MEKNGNHLKDNMPYELIPENIDSSEAESLPSTIGRNIARTTSRIGEQVAGIPGDIFSLINEYIAKPTVEKLTGKPGVSYEETMLGKLLPTTEKHREATTKTLGKLVQPQNDVEKFFDNVFQDATSLAIPGLKGAKLASKGAKSLAIATAANTLGDLTKDITADEKKASMAKMGSLFALSLLDKKKAAQAVGELYKPLEEKISKLAPVSAKNLEQDLVFLQNKLRKGTLAPSEKFVYDEAQLILDKISNSKISPEELWASKRSLNEKLTKVLFDTPEKASQQRARKLAKNIGYSLDQSLKQTSKQDPNFYKDLKKANQAFGVVSESNWITKYIENNMKYNPVTHGLIQLFENQIGSTASAAALPYGAVKIMYRISQSPVLAKHYMKILKSAAEQNAPVLNREMEKLDKKIQQDQKKEKFILID